MCGLFIQRAKLIGVDSLGMDVRVFSGMEAQTLRFSFNARVSYFPSYASQCYNDIFSYAAFSRVHVMTVQIRRR